MGSKLEICAICSQIEPCVRINRDWFCLECKKVVGQERLDSKVEVSAVINRKPVQPLKCQVLVSINPDTLQEVESKFESAIKHSSVLEREKEKAERIKAAQSFKSGRPKRVRPPTDPKAPRRKSGKEGKLKPAILKVLERYPDGVKLDTIEAEVEGQWRGRSVENYLSLMNRAKEIHSRKIYINGRSAYSVYSLNPIPLQPEQSIYQIYQKLLEGTQSTGDLAAHIGKSRSNVTKMMSDAIHKRILPIKTWKDGTERVYSLDKSSN